jgi:hypothetical protein
LLASPDSNIIRFAGAMTIYDDLIPRWIMYKHNINNGMSEREAINDALSALPNYMYGMPSKMKFISDIYVTMFPSFWTRIQATIVALMLRHPASFGAQVVTANVLAELGISGTNITSSNIINKFINDSLTSLPTELPLLPYMHLFG